MDFFYISDFVWGLCVIVSWMGWGSLLQQALKIPDKRSPDWGLRAGWGAAVAIAIGGVLNLCHLSTQPFVVAVVLIGVIAEASAAITRFRQWWPRYRRVRATRKTPEHLRRTKQRLVAAIIFVGPCVVALAFLYVGSVHQPYGLSTYDDFLAYLVFPLRMLQTGTLIEPFSQRRLATFGGHAFLNAMVFSGSSQDMAWTLEMGICPIVIAGLIYGFLRPRTTRGFYFAGLLILISFVTAVPRVNTQSLATGVMMFLTLFRTLALEKAVPLQRNRIEWATFIVVAAVSTLRVNDLIAGFGALILSRAFAATGHSMPGRLKRAGFDSCKACLFLLPWSVLLFASSRTFLWPLMHGNERGFRLLLRTDSSLAALLRWIGTFFLWDPIPILIAPLVLPILFASVRRGKNSRTALCTAIAGLAATIITLAGNSPAVNFTKDIYRFTFPILFSASLAMLMATMTAREVIHRKAANLVAAIALVAYAIYLGNPRYQWEMNLAGMRAPAPSVALFSSDQADYRDLQESIPEGASVLAILNCPNLLNYRRNTIFNADMLLPEGPYPGPPFFEGPDALKRYLKSLHIDYVAAVDFDQDAMSWYSRPNASLITYSNPTFHIYKPYFFDYMHNIDLLERSEQVLFRRNGIRVFRLSE